MNIMHLKSAVCTLTRWSWTALAAVGVMAMVERSSAAEGEATNAPPAPAIIKVKGLQGRVQFSRKDGPFVPVAEATVLRAGDVVRTANGSAVDLDLGEGPGVVRLTEGTVLAIEKVSVSEKGAFDVELTLRSGELLGSLKPGPAESLLEVKTSSGIARPLRGRFRVQSRGFLVLLEGKAIFAHVPLGGEPTAHTLSAPPACYFTPSVGIQPAPRSLVREVTSQLKAKLRRDR